MATEQHSDYREPADDVRVWVAQGSSIMLKAATQHGDPVELTAQDARNIARVLSELADELDRL